MLVATLRKFLFGHHGWDWLGQCLVGILDEFVQRFGEHFVACGEPLFRRRNGTGPRTEVVRCGVGGGDG